MTGKELKEAAETMLGGGTLSTEQTILWTNEALDEISDQGLCYGEVEVDATAGEWYQMPEDVTSIIRIEEPMGTVYNHWKQRGYNEIGFDDSGKYTVIARRQPEKIITLDDEVKVHPTLQRTVITFLRGMFKLSINDESADGHRLMADFKEQLTRAYNILRRNRQPMSWKVDRHA